MALRSYLARPALEISMRLLTRSPYYLIEGVVGDATKNLARLKTAIHLDFANWLATPGGALKFTRAYGALKGRFVSGECFQVYTGDWLQQQEKLQTFWRWSSQRNKWNALVAQLELELKYEREDFTVNPRGEEELLPSQPPLDFILRRRKANLALALDPYNLWQYILLLFMREPLGMHRICDREDCPNRHFIARRRDQKFCSKDCSGLIAKRRWWEAHGEEWRQKWRQRKKKTRR